MESPLEHIRAWAIRLEVENRPVGSTMLRQFEEMAAGEKSALVRLYLASACQRLPAAQRWTLLERLLNHPEDEHDPNLPMMIWYAAEPLVKQDSGRALALAGKSKFPFIREFMARRVVENFK